ncbi:MAG: hypothetical protein A3G93_08035 [Nitrospinae bacterium RIFCSPLOWO2_12_FULL_45_22]|nr:MAG: hypothetical protein A3G93_08035 [Nitrospinae bacterium RIFCSPLOWO2_12_FULL_45_22]
MGFPKIISFIKLYHKHIEKGAILSGITLIALRLYFPIQYHYSYIQGRKIILPNSSSHIAPTVEAGATLLQVLAIAVVVGGLVYLLRIFFNRGQNDPDRLFERGKEYFDEKKYSDARVYLRRATKILEKMGKGKSDYAAKCRYNIAMSYFYEKEHSRGVELLEEVKQIHPKFETQRVDDSIRLSRTLEDITMGISLLTRAEKALNRGDYPSARLYYKKKIEHSLRIGLGSDFIPETKYDIAFTYFSEANYDMARKELLELKRDYPNYNEMEKVEELLAWIESKRQKG